MGAEQLVALQSKCEELHKAADEAEMVSQYDAITIIIIIIIQHLYSAIMSYADTEALVSPVKSE